MLISTTRIKSKVVGNLFEQFFFRAATRQGLGVIRIPDGCKRVPGKFSKIPKLIPVKTPCDYVVLKSGRCALIDTKTQGQGLTFPKSNINYDQVFSMSYMKQHGAVGGYVVHFRDIDKIVFFDCDLLRETEVGIHWEKGMDLGYAEELNLDKIYEARIV